MTMMGFEDLESGKSYIAAGTDGRKYEGTARYFEGLGMIFFCCCPQGVDLVGFEEESS